MPGDRLQLLVEPDRVALQAAMLVSPLSVWKPPAACQVEPEVSSDALDQHDVRPAELGQVVEHGAADDAAADDGNAGFTAHDGCP